MRSPAGLGGHPVSAAAGAAVALIGAVPFFLLRYQWGLASALVAATGIVVICNADAGNVGWFAVLVLPPWCVLAGGNRIGIAAWVICLLLFGGQWLWASRDPGWAPWTAGVSVTVLAAMLIRHQLVLVQRLRAAQAGLAEQSRAEERNRIARELHDVIAHTLTVSLLHVSSARLAVEHDPEGAARALAEAERLGRESLAEVRATMGLLRHDRSEGIAAPVPGLDQVPGLVGQLRGAGANICLVVDGDAASVPATTGSTAYRIVQEALTNATRHAPGAPIEVHLVSDRTTLELSIDSGGPAGQGQGMGLESMQERARAVGGSCSAGPGGCGWLVRASLPLSRKQPPGSP